MGSSLTRHFRDLSDFGGFEAPTVPMVASTSSPNEKSTTSDSRPSTPITHQTVHVLDWDPRSPTSEIVRTPIEISSKNYLRSTQDSPSIGVVHSLKSYLETDLDTLSTRAEVRNENGASQSGSSLPPGLTSSHLMKLKFLGIDPRSPSSDIARTPIQPGKLNQRDEGPFHFDDTLSIGSVSSHDIFNNSLGSSDFIRDCSDPSAFISENEDLSDKDDSLHEKSQEYVVEADGKPKADSFVSHSLAREESNGSEEGVIKPASKVSVFQEDITIECMDRIKTPESIKKSTGHRTRTPLTPICNHSQTPNSILRAKQSLTIEKEILTKAKIYSAEESVTPSKSRSISSAKKENTSGRSRKGLVCKSENLPVVNSKKRSLAQWDQDNSVII